MTRLEYALDYLGRGFAPLPIPARAKNPGFNGWQKYQALDGQLERDFSGEGNVGLLLGEPSGGLIDVDLDWPEARQLAPQFLPPTPMMSGRDGAQRSHYWYRCAGAKTQKWSDPNKREDNKRAMIVELRSTGAQTVVAPSIHPTGEQYCWEGDLLPAETELEPLQQSVSRLAACALLARHWPNGRRHDTALALAGALLRNGWAHAEVERFILAAATLAGDEEPDDRAKAVSTTLERIRQGEGVTGLPTLAELLGARTVATIVKWLGLASHSDRPTGTDNPSARKQSICLDQANGDEPPACPYKANGVGLIWLKPLTNPREGGATTIQVQLTNFTAEITGDVLRDDGAEQSRVFEITAKLAGESASHKGAVMAEEFDSLKWLNTILGARAVVYPSKGEHTRVAIRLLSDAIQARRVIAHTGWRNDGEGWRYYHAGGAIGAQGSIPAEVELPSALAAYSLPAPPTGDERIPSVRAVFDLFHLAPEDVMLPTLGAVWMSVMTGADFSLYLAGKTGSGKSVLAALALSFFGESFEYDKLPASWSSTGNSLESLAHAAKDCVLVVDDFCPTGSAADQSRLQAAADRIFRAQGNHSGRLRCRTDGTVRAVKPPRGLILSTGEDIPHGQSLRARILIREVVREQLNWPDITNAQATARRGVFALAMSAFLQWLAADDRFTKLQARANDDLARWRSEWETRGLSGHKRNATTLAQLSRGWAYWLEFAVETGAISLAERNEHWRRVWSALDAAGKAQDQYQASENPASRFMDLIQAALSSGRAHLAATDHGRPEADQMHACGWREGEAQGDRIGWIDGDDVYLQPDAAFALAQRMTAGGEGLTVSSQTLWKRLNEAGLLASTDTARETLKVRRKIGGKSLPVIHLRAQKLTG